MPKTRKTGRCRTGNLPVFSGRVPGFESPDQNSVKRGPTLFYTQQEKHFFCFALIQRTISIDQGWKRLKLENDCNVLKVLHLCIRKVAIFYYNIYVV